METKDLGPLPKVHPREDVLHKANCHLGHAIARIAGTYGLSSPEVTALLVQELNYWANNSCKQERKRVDLGLDLFPPPLTSE